MKLLPRCLLLLCLLAVTLGMRPSPTAAHPEPWRMLVLIYTGVDYAGQTEQMTGDEASLAQELAWAWPGDVAHVSERAAAVRDEVRGLGTIRRGTPACGGS